MVTHMFVNYATADLDRAKAFYEALGTTIVPEFTDENAACIKWDENVFFMLLKTEFFATFTDRPVVHGTDGAQVITALGVDSREAVDEMKQKILDAGGSENKPNQDYGFMYSISMADPDGNIIEFVWMDPRAAEQGPEAFMADQASESPAID